MDAEYHWTTVESMAGNFQKYTILTSGINTGIFQDMETAKKITVEVPAGLLAKAQACTGTGITPTIRRGLELLAASRAYNKIRQHRGKVKFSIDWRRLRDMDS